MLRLLRLFLLLLGLSARVRAHIVRPFGGLLLVVMIGRLVSCLFVSISFLIIVIVLLLLVVRPVLLLLGRLGLRLLSCVHMLRKVGRLVQLLLLLLLGLSCQVLLFLHAVGKRGVSSLHRFIASAPTAHHKVRVAELLKRGRLTLRLRVLLSGLLVLLLVLVILVLVLLVVLLLRILVVLVLLMVALRVVIGSI